MTARLSLFITFMPTRLLESSQLSKTPPAFLTQSCSVWSILVTISTSPLAFLARSSFQNARADKATYVLRAYHLFPKVCPYSKALLAWVGTEHADRSVTAEKLANGT